VAAAYPGRADGGAIYGPGSSTSDEAGIFRLSNGEHVFDAEDVSLMGGQAAVYAFRQGLKDGTRGYAQGGGVGGGWGTAAYMPAPQVAPQVVVVERGGSGSGRSIEQTFHLPTGLTAAEVMEAAKQERNWMAKSV